MAGGVPKQVLEMLAQVPLFSECSRAELRLIAGLGASVPVDSGATLTKQGAVGREFFLVTSGSARCFRDGKLVARFGPGDFFGEMALLDRAPRTATIVADEPMEVLVLDSREFETMLEDAPSISRKLLKALAVRQRAISALQN
ncbi:MAG TPA: cyclic nucleotide-binding domain-containing protein [Acidimicrobiales bacterium]|jgi:CRP-like cAMP-binding protein